MQKFETWIYDLKGHRRRLYHGGSLGRAKEVLQTAIEIVNTFRLDASMTVRGVRMLGMATGAQLQKDYYAGFPEPNKPFRELDRTLALARKSERDTITKVRDL